MEVERLSAPSYIRNWGIFGICLRCLSGTTTLPDEDDVAGAIDAAVDKKFVTSRRRALLRIYQLSPRFGSSLPAASDQDRVSVSRRWSERHCRARPGAGLIVAPRTAGHHRE